MRVKSIILSYVSYNQTKKCNSINKYVGVLLPRGKIKRSAYMNFVWGLCVNISDIQRAITVRKKCLGINTLILDNRIFFVMARMYLVLLTPISIVAHTVRTRGCHAILFILIYTRQPKYNCYGLDLLVQK